MKTSKKADATLPLPTHRATSPASSGDPIVTNIPVWLRDELQEFAATAMPEATWDEVIIRCLSVGFHAIDGVGFAARKMSDAPVAPTPAHDTDPWEVRMYRALRAATAAAGGALTVDGAEAMRIAPEATSGKTRRAVGYVIGYRARDYGTVTTRDGVLRIAAVGRPAGSALHRYALTTLP